MNDPVVIAVLDKYKVRSEFGMNKYKMSMADNKGDLLYWLDNLQQELMDATLYIERIMKEIKND